LIASGLTDALRQQVTVENDGTGGVACAQRFKQVPPDGYTLLVIPGTLWVAPLLQRVEYDPLIDFAPITVAVTQPNVLVINPALPVHSVAELITYVRAHPGEFRYASGLTGTPSHLAGALFASMASIDIGRVPYQNTAQLATRDLIEGRVHIMIFSAGSAIPHVHAGRLRALAVTTSARSALLPDLPAIAETLPGYQAEQPISLFAPGGTPPDVIKRLNREIVQYLRDPETRRKLNDVGMDAVASTPEELATRMRSEMAAFADFIRAAALDRRNSDSEHPGA
jgi:tripartite-type tricarboxylate transporter receptor subunit TctC